MSARFSPPPPPPEISREGHLSTHVSPSTHVGIVRRCTGKSRAAFVVDEHTGRVAPRQRSRGFAATGTAHRERERC